ncbi:MAG: NAD(P)-dependent oxidoreductase [Rhodospirillales bacterium]|nr:NAD(P)-dependent oxidoreductase [Rhodospirillales bacterium]
MQLITGGMGFIGLHTAKAFLDAGEDVVITRFRTNRLPSYLESELDKRLFIEPLDLGSPLEVVALAKKHNVDGIVHLAAPPLNVWSPAEEYRINMTGLIGVLEAGRILGVKRVAIGSSGTVFSGIGAGPYTEDMNLPIHSPMGSTPATKKAYEIMGSLFADQTGLDVVFLRYNGVWGAGYQSMSNLHSRMVHAAHQGVPGPLPGRRADVHEDDEIPSAYVKDCARATQILQMADKLEHRTYNIAGGVRLTAGEFAEAVKRAVPGAEINLEPGVTGAGGKDAYLDITRIRDEFGFAPEFDVDAGIADYLAWLNAGNER